ncbi:MAG: hypothetical protein PHI27_06355 [Eubacteriales bacterium]|nr:hypothetical protein [Eubacteriales bacterium]MDD3881856.1 hypothetical protein [Eubacteriales bacterium]MDD4512899.1 hypothetical protein [Eubacteriales bacterium]
MRKLFTYLLTVILLVTAVPAMAQVLPSDIINSETRFAIVNSGETQSLLEAVRNGELTREGTTKGIGESIIVQSLTEGLLMLSSNRADVILTLSPTARYVAARNLGLMSVEGVYALDLCMLISN